MARLSTIDRLPARVRERIGALRRAGRTIDEILAKLAELGAPDAARISRSALGRHVKGLDAMAERVRWSRGAAEAIMARLGEDEGRAARLNIELMHASLMDLLAGEEQQPITLDPEKAMLIGRTLRDLATAARHDTERELRVRKEIAARAAKAAGGAARKAGLSAEAIAAIERDVLGIAR
ncbi:MAG: phage protein Gp27 family protein [Kiloniellaceae bacterium]